MGFFVRSSSRCRGHHHLQGLIFFLCFFPDSHTFSALSLFHPRYDWFFHISSVSVITFRHPAIPLSLYPISYWCPESSTARAYLNTLLYYSWPLPSWLLCDLGSFVQCPLLAWDSSLVISTIYRRLIFLIHWKPLNVIFNPVTRLQLTTYVDHRIEGTSIELGQVNGMDIGTWVLRSDHLTHWTSSYLVGQSILALALDRLLTASRTYSKASSAPC